jgi:predicted ATP-grasp superfamily ATP-dependent carboligase
MRIFVYEYCCGGGLSRVPTAASLFTEGWAMLAAVLDDFRQLPDTIVTTLLDARIELTVPGVETQFVRAGEESAAICELARAAEWSLLIAPEFDNILAERCRWVEECGGRLLGPSSEAVRQTADKHALAHHLSRAGILTPNCQRLGEEGVCFPAVCKPRYGAGSQATFLVTSEQELASCPRRAAEEGWQGELLVQPFIRGRAASVAFLIGPAGHFPLLASEQHLSEDGRFHYRGGRVPLGDELGVRAIRVARRAVEAMSGLFGYVGVDEVLGDDGDWVIEINPRLTTSYVGLRRLTVSNLAAAMIRVAEGEAVDLEWRAGEVTFGADGCCGTVS